MKYTLVPLFALCFLTLKASANICGTDYQNFNPTTSGLDFVTVQSTETLKPCIINMGLFLNFSRDSLTYSQVLNNNYPAGQKRKDKTLAADLSAGVGITENWDFGINMPILLNQTVASDHYVSSFDDQGIMEIKANTKYRFWGGESSGLAAVLSMNKNLVEDNPFTGTGGGPTWNFELSADTTFATKWAGAVNLGYRLRDPGEQIVGVPFVPLEDQYIYSLAGSYLFSEIDTKLILELYGSRAVRHVAFDSDRNLNALEALIGIKHDYSESIALHFGGTHQIGESLGGAEWRVYAGLNWAIGPYCKTKNDVLVSSITNQAPNMPKMEEFTLDVELLFGINLDIVDPESFDKLDSLFKEMFARKYDRMVIEGHTDSIGDPDYNMSLSQRRALYVRQEIIARFKIPSDKIAIAGYGQTQPIADNGNYQGRKKNRRVMIKVWR
ncbi:MAG: OmpA family protein [Pseudomonadota bacterium]|nr:OmpA family protein [Pseudomonadota bacterium]